MRLISKDDGTWEMQRIRELEFLMLSKLEEACDPDGSQAAIDRLFPSPLGRPAVAFLKSALSASFVFPARHSSRKAWVLAIRTRLVAWS